jgi:trehalose 6-phosphate phosphatase
LASPGTSGIFVDFDGTLAPIVDTPEQARPLPGADRLLSRLAEHYARVAVISGRPVSFLSEQLRRAGRAQLVGLYGLERTTADRAGSAVEPAATRWQGAVEAAADAAESAAPAGLRVERKGLALTMHFRQAPELADWAARFAAGQARLSGLVAHPGKQSWELRPPVPIDKGTVVAELAAGLAAVCFLGDDTGDLPAFAALGRLRAAGVETLAVAVAGTETPAEMVSGADLMVDGPAGVLLVLEAMAQVKS